MEVPLIIWMMCSVLPFLTGAMVSLLVWTSYRKCLVRYRLMGIDVSKLERAVRTSIVILVFVSVVPFLYGMTLIVLLIMSDGPRYHYMEVSVFLSGIAVGVPIIVSMVAQGSMLSRSMDEYLEDSRKIEIAGKNRDGIKPGSSIMSSPYGRYLILSMVPHSVAVYGLLVGLLILTFSNVINAEAGDDVSNAADSPSDLEFVIDDDNIDRVRVGTWLFSGLSSFTLLSAVLPFIIKGNLMENKVFFKRTSLSIAGTIPAMIGFVVWAISLV